MRLYHDEDADLGLLCGLPIAVVGYGNQGRAQALNLRDSGLDVVIGNRDDAYADRAREDGFAVHPITETIRLARVIMLLIPDEVAPDVFRSEVAPCLDDGKALVFATGYNIAFGLISPPDGVDVIMVAPRMIGAGVRDLYAAGRGFPAFFGVEQDHSGRARDLALALAKGIGATRMGAVETTFRQEAELDLFTEQCFGPAFGQVLTTAVDLLLEEGYPPEAVLLELYLSGEFSYTLAKISEMGMVAQTALHSPTSQYGSMSRGMRFILPELRAKMEEGLEEIQSGRFAQEWAAEQAAGRPTLAVLRVAAQELPLHALEQQVLAALRGRAAGQHWPGALLSELQSGQAAQSVAPVGQGFRARLLAALRRFSPAGTAGPAAEAGFTLSPDELESVLRRFLALAEDDQALQAYSQGKDFCTHYTLTDVGLEFSMRFSNGRVVGALGPPLTPAEVRLETEAEVLDGMFAGRINALRTAMTGRLSFSGETRLAISIQQIQDDLKRLYSQARGAVRERGP